MFFRRVWFLMDPVNFFYVVKNLMQSEGALVNTAASDSSERSKNKLDQKVICPSL